MKLKLVVFSLVACFAIISLGIGRGNDDPSQFGAVRVVPFPADVVVDEYSVPVVSSRGDVGFISSVMTGSLISFSVTSGKIISSVAFGEVAGMVSMVETHKRRLIALPTANDPDHGRPATVSIVNATSAERPERLALVELPGDAHLTPHTRALLTPDARFGVVASSFNRPALFSFNAETGKITSSIELPGWPSNLVLFDGKTERTDYLIGVVSVEANTLSLVKLDRRGRLSAGKSFSPTGMSFDISNNPAFNADGQIVYVAVYNGGHVFSLDTQRGTILGMIKLVSPPQRITVDKDLNGVDLIAVTRGGASEKKSGGVTILASNKGQFTVRTEFTPPDACQFSRANNVVFDADAAVALVASMNGTLFAFDTKSGELASHKSIGKSIRSLVLNNRTHTLVAVRSTPKTDEVAIVDFHKPGLGVQSARVTARVAPAIRRGVFGTHLRISIEGMSFGKGATVEFVKAGDVVFRQTPVLLAGGRLMISVPIKRLEALGRFELRVVSNDKALSNSVTIEPSTLLSGVSVNSGAPATATVLADELANGKVPVAITSRPHAPKSATVVQSVRAIATNGGLLVFVETNGEAKFQDFTLTNPWRVVLDVVNVRNRFGNKTLGVDSEMVERVRVGQPRPGVVRVVLDTTGPVRYSVTREGNSLIVDTRTVEAQPPTSK